MENLTQQQKDAKQAYLDKQQATMLAQYENANREERKAIIKQIDSFLPVTRSKEERIFWLKLRSKLERMNEKVR